MSHFVYTLFGSLFQSLQVTISFGISTADSSDSSLIWDFQVIRILTGSLVGNTLQELQLGMIWGEVEDSLLTRARAVIPQLELEMMKVEPMMPGWDWFSDSD